MKIEETKDAKENVACSDRGSYDNCNDACKCFHGHGSSNGKGDTGSHGDCGYESMSMNECL